MKTISQGARQAISSTTAQQNLHQTHATATEWERARLIACSVEKASSQGVVIRPFGDVGKVMTHEAAEHAGATVGMIERYLKTWNLAAMNGHCDSSGALRPEDGQTARLPEEDTWSMYWKQSA